MGISDLVKGIAGITGDRPHYRPYSINRTAIMVGVPPVPIRGLHRITARHNASQNIPFPSLTGGGAIVSNQNTSGIIEIQIMAGTVSCAGIDVLELTGIAYPIVATDKDTGGTSTIAALACRRIGTPEWRRAESPGVSIFTFWTSDLTISEGLRLTE